MLAQLALLPEWVETPTAISSPVSPPLTGEAGGGDCPSIEALLPTLERLALKFETFGSLTADDLVKHMVEKLLKVPGGVRYHGAAITFAKRACIDLIRMEYRRSHRPLEDFESVGEMPEYAVEAECVDDEFLERLWPDMEIREARALAAGILALWE